MPKALLKLAKAMAVQTVAQEQEKEIKVENLVLVMKVVPVVLLVEHIL